MWEGVDLLLRAVVRTSNTKVTETKAMQPDGFRLQAYPNPFDQRLFVRVDGPEAELATVEIFDLLGRLVWRGRGTWFFWDGRDVKGQAMARGVYILRARRRDRTATLRVVKAR